MSMSTKILTSIRRNWIPIGVATTAAAAIALTTYTSSLKEKIQQAKELEKSRHQEALRNIEKESSPISTSLFQDGAGFLNSIMSEKDDSSASSTSSSDKEHQGQDVEDDEEEDSSSNSMLFPGQLKHILQAAMPKGDDKKDQGNDPTTRSSNGPNRENTKDSTASSIASIATSFASLVTGEISESEFNEMIHHAQNMTQKGDVDETRSTVELVNLFLTTQEEVKQHITASLGFLDLKGFDPTSMFYYLENEDAVKNPSWKRRRHRYCKGVDVSVVNGLNDALHLAEISYMNTVDEIKAQLMERAKDKWELIYCQLDSLPEKPSHYLAIKKGQSRWDPQLEILMAVRGTNSVPDLFTDALLDDVDYKDGKAHAGILRSGQYLVGKHRELLLSLLEKSKKKEIKLTLVGHSLGAGAAAIAGIEFHSDERGCFKVEVVGFGCPAILSQELSEQTKSYITTVVADADMVPRMSAETIGNVMLDIMEYDWSPMVKRDIEDALQEVKKGVGFLFQDKEIKSADKPRIMQTFVDKAVEKYVKPGIRKESYRRLDTVLHPPGSCVHFYRDGVGISGSYVPCGFFNEIDVARTMVDDHLSSGYRKIFLEVMRSFLKNDHFSFDEKAPK